MLAVTGWSAMRIASRQYSAEGHLAEIDRRLEQSPDAVELCFERACCLEDLGWEAASAAYLTVLKHDTRHLGALTNLGLMVRETGDLATARALFTQAVTHHPLSTIAYVNLAQTLFEQGEVESAVAQFALALKLDPEFFAAHHGLGLLYEAAGDAALARHHLERAFAKRASWTLPYRGSARPLRVLLLVSARGGDIVMHPFLDDRIVETTMFVPEGFRPETPLPPHDVVFNGIGDADRCGKALERIRALLAASPAAVINDPERVLASGRAAVAQRLAAVPGVVVPRTERIARATLAADERTAPGWTFPLLVRTPGHQGGRHFEFAGEPGELDAALARLPGDEVFRIAFVDTRGADALFRKYRVLFVDGRLYPVHLAISRRWKVHYFSADMAEHAEHRDEERAFLDDMPAVLGPAVIAALEQIARTLGLDYGGIDFGLDAAGNVVVFEANATMAVYLPDAEERWAYRQPAFAAIVAAVRALIERRAGPLL
jgi:tetratricopeptide (TPR) repeat protein